MSTRLPWDKALVGEEPRRRRITDSSLGDMAAATKRLGKMLPPGFGLDWDDYKYSEGRTMASGYFSGGMDQDRNVGIHTWETTTIVPRSTRSLI